MTSAQTLKEQLIKLEAETALAAKSAQEKLLALDAKIQAARAQEIQQGRAEIEKVLKKYNLSSEQAFGTAEPQVPKQAPVTKPVSYLSEIRAHFTDSL